MNIEYDFDSIPHQRRFHLSTKPKVYLSTGFGGGKTYSLVMKIFAMMNANPGIPGGLLVPDLKMYKRDVLPTIMDIIRNNGIMYKYNKSEFHWFFHATGSEMWVFHSQDDGQSIRGPNLGWSATNEVTLCTEMAYKALLGRVRHGQAKLRQNVVSGTPEGFNWAYKYFIENPREDTELIFGDARANKFIHEDYFQDLEASYDEKMQEMYIEGKFINLSGDRAIHSFDRRRHVSDSVERIPDLPVLVALDFNVNPLAASLCNVVNQSYRSGKKKTRIRIFDEICLKGSNTPKFVKELKNRLQIPTFTDPDSVVIYPDPSGVSRSTKSNYTDIELLQLGGFKNVKYKRAPSVRDSVNALNNMFAKDEIEVNAKCKNVIADMEQCIFKGNDFQLNKKDQKRTHWLDGLRYLVEYEFPVLKRRPAREARYL